MKTLRSKNLAVIAAIAVVAAVGITIAIFFSSFTSSSPLLFSTSKLATEEKKNNNVLIDMTTEQWKFLPVKAEPDSNAKLSTAPRPNGAAFADTTISVKKGDVVTLRIKNLDVTHGFGLDEFGINETTPPGQVTEIKFTANKEGAFTFYCTVFCGTGHPNHKGTLIVEA